MAPVELHTTCGTPYLVDADVAETMGHFAWKLDRDGYVYRKTTVEGRRGRSVRLHREVLGTSDPEIYVDHKDGNRLDCTRDNLRATNRSGNAQNRSKRDGTLSRFKGVTRAKKSWQAQIDGKYIGVFSTEDEAGNAYNKLAIVLHGEFARLNPVGIDPHQQSEGATA